jgi:hypothetical protein
MREAFFGLSTDWKEGINWANVRDWRLKRAHAEMEKAGPGALLLFYDENMRYVSSGSPRRDALRDGDHLRDGLHIQATRDHLHHMTV